MWSFLYCKTECVLQINTEIYFYLISYAISIGKFILETKKIHFLNYHIINLSDEHSFKNETSLVVTTVLLT